MVIYNDIQVLLAALKPSQYRDYWKLWKGRPASEDNIKLIFNNNWPKYLKTNFPELLQPFMSYKDYIKKIIDIEYNKGTLKPYLKSLLKPFYEDDITDEEFDRILEKDFSFSNIDKLVINLYESFPITGNNKICINYVYEKRKYNDKITERIIKEKDKFYEELKKSVAENKNINYSSDNIYKKLFNNKYRVALDINISSEDLAKLDEVPYLNGYLDISEVIDSMKLLIIKYYEILNKNEEIAALKKNTNYNEDIIFTKNYIEGYYISPVTGIKISIGKIFNLVKKKDPEFKIKDQNTIDIEKIYNNRVVPFKGKIIISRHPYDIAGMSTDRGWTSCMNLGGSGSYKNYVFPAIINGTLIAYLVNENDTNINKPISRLLIKPYVKRGEAPDFDNPNWLLKVSNVYGQNYEKFSIIVQDWFDTNWNNKIKNNITDYTVFRLHDSSYRENDEEDIEIND